MAIISDMIDHCKAYLASTAVHGMRYIGQENSIIVRIIWIGICGWGFTMAGMTFNQLLQGWDNNAVITTVDGLDIPVTNLPFPTATLCTESKYTNDEWGFIRILLASLQFECTSSSVNDSQCLASIPLRDQVKKITDHTIDTLFYELFKFYTSSEEMKNATIKKCYRSMFQNGLPLYKHQIGKMADFKNFFNTNITVNSTEACSTRMARLEGMFRTLKRMAMINYKIDFGNFMNAYRIKGHKDILPSVYDFLWKVIQNISLSDIDNSSSVKNVLFLLPYIFGDDDWALEISKDHCSKPCTPEELKSMFEILMSKKQRRNICCNPLTQKLKTNLTEVLTVMKYFIPHHGVFDSPSNLLKKLQINRILDFPMKTANTEFMMDYASMIPKCFFGYSEQAIYPDGMCNLWVPMPTSNGICYSFNAPRPTDAFSKSASNFTSAFNAAFEPEYKGSDVHQEPRRGDSVSVLKFVLDNGRNDDGANEISSNFVLSISNNLTFFDSFSSSTLIRMGYENNIYVKPLMKVSHGIESLSIEQRKCRFEWEALSDDLSIFSFYSSRTCLRECQIGLSIRACGCRPWDLPFNDGMSHYPLCIVADQPCLNEWKYNVSLSDHPYCKARCPSDCNSLSFDITKTEIIPFARSKYCFFSKTVPAKSAINQRKLDERLDSMFLAFALGQLLEATERSLMSIEIVGKLDSWVDFRCHSILSEQAAIVSVYFSDTTFVQYRQALKAKIGDKISSLGGLLSLFTGMSFISFVEVTFWLAKFTFRKIYSPKNNMIGHSE